MLFITPYEDDKNLKFYKPTNSEIFYDFDIFKSKIGSEVDRKIISSLKNIEKQVDNLVNIIYNDKIDESKQIKWNFAAKVMDRLFLYISTAYFIITFTSLVLNNRNFYNPV